MRAICIARHPYLSQHLCAFFSPAGVDALPAVGIEAGMQAAREHRPDLIFCDYDILVATPLARWEEDPALAGIPLVAVSLTRRPDEVHLPRAEGLAGFFYLPTLSSDDAMREIRGALGPAVRPPDGVLVWPPEHSAVRLGG